MPHIAKQKVKGKEYYYLRKSVREGEKVKSKNIAYLGKNKKEAKEKAGKIIKEMENKKKLESQRKIIPKGISVEELAIFCKRKGFVYPSAEIYGGFAGFWDFGHLGVELKKNIKKEWWSFFVHQREDIVGIDGSIITNPKVWEASGHVESFSDIFVICKKCKKINKIDKSELGKAKCEFCGGDYDEKSTKEFQLMFRTNVGEKDFAYLRPETAQLIFTDFKFVAENARLKLPFGIAQVGKAFRNEIAPRDFLFRSREFEQMEIEYFIKPNQGCHYEIPDAEILVYSAEAQEKGKEPVKMKFKEAFEKGIIKKKWHAYWLAMQFLWFKNLTSNYDKFRIRQHKKTELAHYSSDCWDLEYNFPFGWKELEGIADRGNYDLTKHEQFSKTELKIFDEETKQRYLPEVICEPSLGVERAFLVFLFDAYNYDEKAQNIVLNLAPKLAPIKAAIFPIVKREDFEKISEEIYRELKREFNVLHDISGSIGRRYARNDEIGTPFCITIDEDSLKKKEVTIRDRDSAQQVKVKISKLKEILRKAIYEEEDILKLGKIVDTRKK